MIIIDLTAELAPLVIGLGAVVVVAALGIAVCVDPREVPVLRRWVASLGNAIAGLRGARVASWLASVQRG